MSARRTRAGRIASLVALAFVVTIPGAASGSARTVHRSARPAAPGWGPVLFRFVSMPDFINADIGDTRLRAGLGWDPGDPNSINPHWTRSLDTVLEQVGAEKPAFVLVAGDLVNGHWLTDTQHTGIFGPTDTNAQKLRAVATAGEFYDRAFARRFNRSRLTVYPAIGDHDIGDDPWPRGWLKVRAIAAYRRVWADQFTMTSDGGYRFPMHPSGPSSGTAYAFRVDNTLFVTVDEFASSARGVELTVDPDQLRWLEHLLARARSRDSGIEHIVVQGHLPVLGRKAPSIPSYRSSRLFFLSGVDSAFWRVLHRYDVDVYLAGEMHAYSMRNDGVMQIVHGSVVGSGHENYLVATVYVHRIALTIKQFSGRTAGDDHLWQMSYARALAYPVIDPNPTVVARLQVP